MMQIVLLAIVILMVFATISVLSLVLHHILLVVMPMIHLIVHQIVQT